MELADKRIVIAITAICPRSNLIRNKSISEIAQMARVAEGKSGKCSDYVENVAIELERLGINDPAVREFRQAMRIDNID
jgi:cation transport regulator ChaC